MIADLHLESAWSDVASQLRGYIRARVRDHAAAEDLLQEVFLKAQKRAGQLESAEKMAAWLFQIARHAVVDHYRSTGARAQRTMALSKELDLAAEQEREPLECERKLRAALHGMIHSLPEPYREALVLTEYEGLTQRELADRLHISISGAKSRVQRAREKLREAVLRCCALEFDRRGNVIECAPKKDECSCSDDSRT